VNVGNVVMLRGEWQQELIGEMRNFPNGKHDDQIDALSLAFDYLNDNSLGLLDFYRQQAAEREQLRAGGA
jgi:phage terminase large subunit-like protein